MTATCRLSSVSIIITNHNYGRFLQEAIESALNQSCPSVEVIIVDDGSSDDSRAIIEKYRERTKIIFKTNGGQASAFNSGLPLAKGEIVLFLDSDDYLMPNAVDRIIANWKPHISRCHFRLKKIDSDGNQIGEEPMPYAKLPSGYLFKQQLSMEGCTWVPTSGNAFSRAVLEKVFPVDERIRVCADGLLVYQTAFHGDVLAIEEILGAYRIHDSNNFAGSYLEDAGSDSQAIKFVSGKLFAIHARIGICLSLENGAGSFFSTAKKYLNLQDIRTLLIAKYLHVVGPLIELDKQFTFLQLHGLLLAACLQGKAPFKFRLRCLAEAVILSTLPKSRRAWWVRNGFDLIRRRLRNIFER
jgi:glycosyltransferase involved in cell wall biosynthesis